MDVEISTESSVAVITINRPNVRNCVNAAVAQGIADAIAHIERAQEVRVGIITGAGGNFCAGLDLGAFLRGESASTPESGFAGITRAFLTKPMIAAVEGYALAGGFEIALACDFIIASESARFGFPEVKRGLVATAGGLLRVQRQLPARIAAELVLTGDMFDAASLAHYGLFNTLVPVGQALEAAKTFAQKLVANAPISLAVSKRVLRESQDWRLDEMFARQDALTAPVFATADAKEGAKAFAENRPPIWRGK